MSDLKPSPEVDGKASYEGPYPLDYGFEVLWVIDKPSGKRQAHYESREEALAARALMLKNAAKKGLD